MWAADRLHFSPLGHHTIARSVLATLDVKNSLEPRHPEPITQESWRHARSDDVVWARTYLVPWLVRRARHRSSGDHMNAKQPEALPLR